MRMAARNGVFTERVISSRKDKRDGRLRQYDVRVSEWVTRKRGDNHADNPKTYGPLRGGSIMAEGDSV